MGLLSNRVHEVKRGYQAVLSVPMRGSTLDIGAENSLVKVCANYDAVSETRGIEVPLHVSQLIDPCERQLVLLNRAEVLVPYQPSGWTRMIWEQGRATEQHVRRNILSAAKEGLLRPYGRWECACGKRAFVGEYKRKKCPTCGHRVDRYKELALKDRHGKVIGSPDISLIDFEGLYVPVEFKSINKVEFDAMKRPFGNHLIQVFSYRRLLKEQGKPVADYVIVMYAAKQSSPRVSPYKQYNETITPAMNGIVKDLFRTGHKVAEHIEEGTLPDRCRECAKKGLKASRARSCPVAAMCFSLREGVGKAA